ncbi:hypothetical protein [Granulicella tundricola]|uniref:hypothetical protein n=1 Tax=Granulicella tundricola TaxID=940615 RepID=UPI0001DB7D9E|nr:hypothetical protein [Granulicella tundricola]
MTRRISLVLLFLFALPLTVFGHVGSKDVFETVHAGPYILNVTIRPPNVIPGIATVEIRSFGASITGLSITPLPMTGEASKHPPAADVMTASKVDPAFYTGGVWIMAAGAWQVRLDVDGPSGHQSASVPVLAVPLETLKMQPAMGWGLAALGLFLVLSMGGIVAASFREARLRPGLIPTPNLRRRSLLAMVASLAVMALFVYLGAKWWNVEAAGYAENIYTRPTTSATLKGDQMDLLVAKFRPNPEASSKLTGKRLNDDYLPDHGKLIHLYAIREPEMDAAYHLHPSLVAPGDFRMNLPPMPAGQYRLYGDVVHANGFPETLLATLDIPVATSSVPLAQDDAEAHPAPLSRGPLGPSDKLPDGYTMT